MGFRASVRRATVDLLEQFMADTGQLRQVYPGRPASIFPPCAFVEAINEPEIGRTGSHPLIQRTPRVSVRLVRGDFDNAEHAMAQDELVDGFLSWVLQNRHAAGPRTLIELVAIEDDPAWFPDWFPPEKQRSYYSTLMTLEGLSLVAD